VKEKEVSRIFLLVAIISSVLTYLFWPQVKSIYYNSFYLGNALAVFSIATVVYIEDRKCFWKFFLFSITLSNLFDEIFFDPQKLSWNELAMIVVLPISWLLRDKTS
jgi:hypothetical protein